MKKTLLLATTAMLLSTVAMNTNAASNSATLHIGALFVKPMELISEQYLGFGMILADEGGKTVVVTSDGVLDEASTTATMISTATYNTGPEGSLMEGVIRLKGFLNEDYDGYGFLVPTGENMDLVYTASFSDTEVELKSNTDSLTCGTVNNFTTKYTADGDDAILHIGGKLTTADLRGQTRSLMCNGSTTVTVIVNEDFMESY